MNRQVLIVIVSGICSAAAFGVVIGLWWLISSVVVGLIPHLVHARLEASYGVLAVLLFWLVLLGAGLAAALARRKRSS